MLCGIEIPDGMMNKSIRTSAAAMASTMEK
jgi:hypothetical protein